MMRRYLSGTLSPTERLEAIMPSRPDTASLLVACRPDDYSASAFAKAVEDCDIQLLTLSVTGMSTDDGRLIVALTVNARTTGGVSRSLERYGYEVIHAIGPNNNIEHLEAIERVNELIHYLEM